MSRLLKFENNPALKMAKEKAKAELDTVKKAIAAGTYKSKLGNFPNMKPNNTKKGRPPTLKNGRDFKVRMGEDDIQKAEAIGDGNVSLGVRTALSKYKVRSKG